MEKKQPQRAQAGLSTRGRCLCFWPSGTALFAAIGITPLRSGCKKKFKILAQPNGTFDKIKMGFNGAGSNRAVSCEEAVKQERRVSHLKEQLG